MSTPDLSQPCRIHIIGIGGAGMSAIATVLSSIGHTVSGSDLRDSAVLTRLRTQHIEIDIGHDAAHVAGVDIVAISTAIPESNVELQAAREGAIPVFRRAEVLAAITALRGTLSVSGTHGKTTTSSMLAVILTEAGVRPSFLIGGEVSAMGTNAIWDDGPLLVVEADESDGTFTELATKVAVVTNIEPDHLDFYGSFDALQGAFAQFLKGATDHCVVCADDDIAVALAPSNALTYGFSQNAQLRITNFGGGRSNISFDLHRDGVHVGNFAVPVPGEHNARNAAGAVAAALVVGISPEAAQRGLARFAGVARRFEFRGERDGIIFVDDYAHLPGEVLATLAAARRGGFGRVVCVFQPHRISRTAMLAPEFASAFNDADVLVVTDIYTAGEQARPGVTAMLVVDAVRAANPTKDVVFAPRREDVINYLTDHLRPGDCCLSLGAGDLTTLADEMLTVLP